MFLEGSLAFEQQSWAVAQGKLIACREIMGVRALGLRTSGR